jgi:hypothetical protein
MQGRKVHRVLMAVKAIREYKVVKAIPEPRVLQVPREHKVFKVQMELKAIKVIRGQQVHKAQQVAQFHGKVHGIVERRILKTMQFLIMAVHIFA